MNKGALIYV